MFRVLDLTSGGKRLGHFFMDPYIRDDKGYAGADKAWYVPIRAHSGFAGESGCLPLGALILSLPVPNYGKPSLLNLAEVEEVFRHFGNIRYISKAI